MDVVERPGLTDSLDRLEHATELFAELLVFLLDFCMRFFESTFSHEWNDTDYARVIESDVPIVVQHTRLDSRRAENALVSSVALAD